MPLSQWFVVYWSAQAVSTTWCQTIILVERSNNDLNNTPQTLEHFLHKNHKPLPNTLQKSENSLGCSNSISIKTFLRSYGIIHSNLELHCNMDNCLLMLH